ncbi:MAG: YIP1 family protein [Spirochaetales bacterium]|nr:YIP1 family protein [Spirochaetales bacterium]
MKSILLWKDIIFSPFEGFKKVTAETRILLPLLVLVILLAGSIAMLMPIMQSEAYGQAIVRSQIAAMAEKGQEMSNEQQEAMREQLSSPMVKNITIASAFGGGIITFIAILLISSLLIMVASKLFKGAVTYKMAMKILIYAGIISVIHGLVKNGITLSGNYTRILNQVQDTGALQLALTSQVSLAALFSAETLGSVGYFLMDTLTDIFNWIYFIFIYAGLKSAGNLDKKQAGGVTLVYILCYIIIGLIMTLIV